jgi:predicted RNA-binding Zn-ribbon protein involved in translation (DUF1610 family)
MTIPEVNNQEDDMYLCCPNCGYTGLYYETGMKLGPIYHCKRCGYIGTFVIEANQEMRKTIENGLTTKINNNPFTADEYIPLKRKILYSTIVMFAIYYALVYLFPGHSTTLTVEVFIFYLLFVLFTYLKWFNQK